MTSPEGSRRPSIGLHAAREVADVIALIGGDWFQSETGSRLSVAQLMTEGKTGVGKPGTGASQSERSACDLSAGVVSSGTRRAETVLA